MKPSSYFAHARIRYNPLFDALFLEYTHRVTSHDQFVEINTAASVEFSKLNTAKFVADIRKMGAVEPASEQWFFDYHLERLQKHLGGKTLIYIQLDNPSDILPAHPGKRVRDKPIEISGVLMLRFVKKSEMSDYLRHLMLFSL
ncbi:MAG TPA: hypothetical protein VIN08_18395 [Ohtaekwangia sp.]|uniref:hypothetical protein n=1 Tax=Ohtaekwangia sp. TaxID=2066019 RepID=UPI002F92CB5E